MIFNKWLVIGEDCIIANFLIYFKNLVNFYIARNRLHLSVSLPTAVLVKTKVVGLQNTFCGHQKHQHCADFITL